MNSAAKTTIFFLIFVFLFIFTQSTFAECGGSSTPADCRETIPQEPNVIKSTPDYRQKTGISSSLKKKPSTLKKKKNQCSSKKEKLSSDEKEVSIIRKGSCRLNSKGKRQAKANYSKKEKCKNIYK